MAQSTEVIDFETSEAERQAASELPKLTEWSTKGGKSRVDRLLGAGGCSVLVPDFHLCTTCYGLFQDHDGRKVQRCRCQPRPENEGRWEGYDFNCHIQLCQCCGWEWVQGIVRYSSLLGDCGKYGRALNDSVQACVIPTGRHSIMNGVSADVRALEIPGGIEKFTSDFNKLRQEWDRQSTWQTREVKRNVARLRRTGLVDPKAKSIWLSDYILLTARLRRVRATDPTPIYRDAFTRYATWLGVPKPVTKAVIESVDSGE